MSARNEQTDLIAREAARMLVTARTDSVADAIGLAMKKFDLTGAPRPSEGHVRQHVQGMNMQALGEAGYRDWSRNIYITTEELMLGMQELIDDSQVVLMGRAAQGHIDGPTTLHLRIYTDARVEHILNVILTLGYEEPAFETSQTRYGRLNRLRFMIDSIEYVITRCPPGMNIVRNRDLFRDEAIAVATVEDVQAHITSLEKQHR